MKPRLVLGIGNLLMRDEGVGVRVTQALQTLELPDDVEVADGGTLGPALVDIIADRKKLIVVDAVAEEHEPGTVLRYSHEQAAARESASLSLHEVGILETLRIASLLGCSPEEVIIFGIIPEIVDSGLELSPRIAAVVPRVAEVIRRELTAAGALDARAI